MLRGWRGILPKKQADVITAIIGKWAETLTQDELDQLKQYIYVGDKGTLHPDLLTIARNEINTWSSMREGRIAPPRTGDTLGNDIASYAPDGMEDRPSLGKRMGRRKYE